MNQVDYSNWKGWDEASFGAFTRLEALYYSAELARSGVRRVAGMRILEVGFGNGTFAAWAVGQGARYSGMEAIPTLVERGRTRGFDVHLANLPPAGQFGPDSVDLVVAFDVFEHLEPAQLTELFLALRTLLKSGGRLIARVPSGDSPFSGSLQHGDLSHRSTLGSGAVRQLAQSTGYVIDQLREPVIPLVGTGPIRFLGRSVVRLARRIAYPVIAALLVGNDSAVLSPNMLFVLRKAR